ncbi:DUF4249 domain-containing protein [Spirosoma arcticum]
MKLTALFSLLVVTTLTFSCESAFVKVVNPDNVPKGEQKLTVHCYISPQDTVLAAVVNRSRAVVGEPNSFRNGSLPDAVVTLSDGNQSVELRYESVQGGSLYRTDARLFPIQVGKTYTLKASLPSGESVSATCTVPGPVSISSFRIDSLPDPNISDGLAYYVKTTWQDPVGVVNYYRVAGDNEYNGIRLDVIQGQFVEVPIRAVGSLFFGDKGPYLNDHNLDGRTMTSLPGRLSFSYSNGKRNAGRPILINFYLLNVDVNYYRYHESLDRAIIAQDNPFAEPTSVVSNVQEGLGCFGAYNRTLWSTTLR